MSRSPSPSERGGSPYSGPLLDSGRRARHTRGLQEIMDLEIRVDAYFHFLTEHFMCLCAFFFGQLASYLLVCLVTYAIIQSIISVVFTLLCCHCKRSVAIRGPSL